MRIAYAEGLASPEVEMAEGGTMLDNKSKFADLKAMLDSNKEGVKMDAMKRIINMVARGKDVSDLFPQVVKNVAVKNLELKKLVYVYLVRYAEEQQDLALLSISTFQRALKDPNQLIRASALRVLSSVRVQMIAPVMMLSIKESVRDMSAYVRKVAAHAIPKLYALDPDLQPQLIECIDFLLGDKRTLVLGSAVYAFEQTCPTHLQLLHRHFRSLCRALADVDEWGQVVMIGLLTRYARTQFTSPTFPSSPRNHHKGKEEEDEDDEGEEEREASNGADRPLDPDHLLLISSCRPLLQSRNYAVVMAVAQLLYYISPPAQLSIVPKALVRLLRGPNEVQYVVLVNIATICSTRNDMVSERVFAISKNLFEPFLKSFFVRASDTMLVKQLKLQVLTSLVSETNVQLVIRELQAYLQMPELASHAIEAIGRCALQVEAAAEPCLSCLINLISSPRETIVCSAVVVLKRLLHGDAPLPLLKRVVKLIDSVKAPMARACVLWLVSTHIDKVGLLAPDVLRKIAKRYADEDDCVKLQSLSLAARLWATQRERCEVLVRYVLQLARYDRSYDIRDRCRFIRNLLTNPNCQDAFPLAEIFLAEKPVPTLSHGQFTDREHYQLGTLSHLLNQPCSGYSELPEFPPIGDEEGRRARKAAHPQPVDEAKEVKRANGRSATESFYSNDEGGDEEDDDEDEEEEDEDEEEDDEEEEEEEGEEDEEQVGNDGDEEGEAEEDEEEASSSEEETESDEQESLKPAGKKAEPLPIKVKESGAVRGGPTDLELLLDLDFNTGMSSPTSMTSHPTSNYTRASTQHASNEFNLPLLNAINTQGLSIDGRFTRSQSLFSNSMVTVELRVEQQSAAQGDIRIKPKQGSKEGAGGQRTSGPANIYALKRGEKKLITVGVDFGDSGRSSEWLVHWAGQQYELRIEAPLGEQLEPIEMSAEEFEKERANPKMTGMHQLKKRVAVKSDFTARGLLVSVNCKPVREMKWCYAAQSVSRKDLVLISLAETEVQNERLLVMNCENVSLASLLFKEIENVIKQGES